MAAVDGSQSERLAATRTGADLGPSRRGGELAGLHALAAARGIDAAERGAMGVRRPRWDGHTLVDGQGAGVPAGEARGESRGPIRDADRSHLAGPQGLARARRRLPD